MIPTIVSIIEIVINQFENQSPNIIAITKWCIFFSNE